MQNIILINDHTKEPIKIIGETNLTFRSESQLQDLENYNVCFTFDFDIVSDENSKDCLDGSKYITGYYEKTIGDNYYKIPIFSDKTVSLYVNGCNIFKGKLNLIENHIDSFKVVYQCVPSNGILKDFEFKDTLRDYFVTPETFYQGIFIGSFFNWGVDSISMSGYKFYQDEIPHLKVDIENNPFGDYKMNTGLRLGSFGEPVPFERGYWVDSKINDFLRCMCINPFDSSENNRILFKGEIKWERKLKVRMYLNREFKIPLSNLKEVVYSPTSQSPIWWFSELKKDWELLECPDPYKEDWSTFKDTIRDNKGFKGLSFDKMEFDSTFDLSSIDHYFELNDGLNNQPVSLLMRNGFEYSDWDDLGIIMIVSDESKCPSFVDVYFDCKIDVDFDKYNESFSSDNEKNIYNHIPYLQTDLSFLNTKTNDFLNGLSLNCKGYEFLRNPSFINKFNYKSIHNLKSSVTIFDLTNEQIETFEKEKKDDNPKKIILKTNFGLEHTKTKDLNGVEDEKEIEQTFTSLCFRRIDNKGQFWKNFDVPPLVELLSESSEKYEIQQSNVKGVFFEKLSDGQIPYSFNGTLHNDFDYLNDYNVSNETYECVCVGYRFQEKVRYGNQMFVVQSYETNDFVKFKLKLFKDNNSQIY